MIFLLYLLSLLYTACTDHGTHSISHCTPEGWWSQIKEALHFSNAQPILSEVCFFLHEESLLSLNKTKAKNTHTGSGAVDIAAGRYALQLFLLRTLPSLWLSHHFFFFLHSFKVYLPHQGTELSVARTNHLFHLSVLFFFSFCFRVENSESLIRPFDQRPVAGDFYDPVNPASFSFLFAPFGAASVRR